MEMKHEGRLLEEIQLENGLNVSFYDFSRPVAGDRYQVELVVAIPMAIREGYFEDCREPRKAYEAFVAAHGNVIRFEQQRIRNFIAKDDVPAVLRQLQEEFLRALRYYLLKEGFAAKFIMKTYQEWEDEQRLNSLVEGAVRNEPAE
jgi:hypothetical protein